MHISLRWACRCGPGQIRAKVKVSYGDFECFYETVRHVPISSVITLWSPGELQNRMCASKSPSSSSLLTTLFVRGFFLFFAPLSWHAVHQSATQPINHHNLSSQQKTTQPVSLWRFHVSSLRMRKFTYIPINTKPNMLPPTNTIRSGQNHCSFLFCVFCFLL